MFDKTNPIYLITDRSLTGPGNVQIVRKALSAGVRMIQLREKKLSKVDIFHEADTIRKLTLKYRALFIVNDHLDIAMAVKADGVHLGQEDLPIEEARSVAGGKMIIGISTHNLRQAVAAQNAGADYIGFGPIFLTKTKDAGPSKGTGKLKEIRKHIKIPISAIGGIKTDNVQDVLNSGADTCAVASGILKGDIKRNVMTYLEAIKLL